MAEEAKNKHRTLQSHFTIPQPEGTIEQRIKQFRANSLVTGERKGLSDSGCYLGPWNLRSARYEERSPNDL